jgi:hypothetical protein
VKVVSVVPYNFPNQISQIAATKFADETGTADFDRCGCEAVERSPRHDSRFHCDQLKVYAVGRLIRLDAAEVEEFIKEI